MNQRNITKLFNIGIIDVNTRIDELLNRINQLTASNKAQIRVLCLELIVCIEKWKIEPINKNTSNESNNSDKLAKIIIRSNK